MSKLDLLKKIIREEVRAAIREELPKILKENASQSKDFKKELNEKVSRATIPQTLNTETFNPIKNIKFDNSNPLGKLLNETAISMTSDDAVGFSKDNYSMGISELQSSKKSSVGSVSDMLARAKKSSATELVEIDTVPDFSGLMNKLKERGEL